MTRRPGAVTTELRRRAHALRTELAAIQQRLVAIEAFRVRPAETMAMDRVEAFLQANPALAFTRREIAEAVCATEHAARSAVQVLHRRGHIERVGPGRHLAKRREP